MQENEEIKREKEPYVPVVIEVFTYKYVDIVSVSNGTPPYELPSI